VDGYRYLAAQLKALGHPDRLRVMLALQREGEACVCHLEALLGIRQATLSQHLARLRDAGLVSDRRDGMNVYYSLVGEAVAELLACAQRAALASTAEPLAFAPLPPADSLDCCCPRCLEARERSAPARQPQGT